MKLALSLLACLLTALAAGAEKVSVDPALKAAVEGVEKRLEARFDKPFPVEWDIDVYRKQPIGVVTVNGGKVSATKPIVNPYDGESIEWMIGPEKDGELPKVSLEIFLHLENGGGLSQISLIADPDDWPDKGGLRQIERKDGETGTEFFKRMMLTYRLRAKEAKDPAQAELFLAGLEKMAAAIETLHKEALLKKDK